MTELGSRLSAVAISVVESQRAMALLPEGAKGCDWIGLNLDDGSALMAFRLRGHDGQPLWSVASFHQAGGSAQVSSPEAVAFEPLRLAAHRHRLP